MWNECICLRDALFIQGEWRYDIVSSDGMLCWTLMLFVNKQICLQKIFKASTNDRYINPRRLLDLQLYKTHYERSSETCFIQQTTWMTYIESFFKLKTTLISLPESINKMDVRLNHPSHVHLVSPYSRGPFCMRIMSHIIK